MKLSLLFEGGREPGESWADYGARRKRERELGRERELEAGFEGGFDPGEPVLGKVEKKGVGGAPDYAGLLRLLGRSKRDWEVRENPGDLGRGGFCPECGERVEYKYVGFGAPKFLGCVNDHAWVLLPREERVRRVRPDIAGRPAPGLELDPEDSKLMRLLAGLKRMGEKRWKRGGAGEGFGRRITHKGVCEVPGCGRRVSHVFGTPKPFCSEHVMENPFARELGRKLGELGMTGGETRSGHGGERGLSSGEERRLKAGIEDAKRAREAWLRAHGEFAEPGDPGPGELEWFKKRAKDPEFKPYRKWAKRRERREREEEG